MCRQTLEDVQAFSLMHIFFSVDSSQLNIRYRETYNTGIKREATNLELLRPRGCSHSALNLCFAAA